MRLLYAEDEEDLNRIVTKKLTEEGFSVDSCFDGREAIDNVQFTEYDAAIPDIMNKTKKFLATLALCGLIITNGATSSVLAADKIISQSAAVSAAYKKAGVTKSQVSTLEVDYDADDDEYGQVYDIEFRTADNEYDYEINAKTGKVVEFSVEPIDYDDED